MCARTTAEPITEKEETQRKRKEELQSMTFASRNGCRDKKNKGGGGCACMHWAEKRLLALSFFSKNPMPADDPYLSRVGMCV